MLYLLFHCAIRYRTEPTTDTSVVVVVQKRIRRLVIWVMSRFELFG